MEMHQFYRMNTSIMSYEYNNSVVWIQQFCRMNTILSQETSVQSHANGQSEHFCPRSNIFGNNPAQKWGREGASSHFSGVGEGRLPSPLPGGNAPGSKVICLGRIRRDNWLSMYTVWPGIAQVMSLGGVYITQKTNFVRKDVRTKDLAMHV